MSRLETVFTAISRALLFGAAASVLAMTALVVLSAYMRYFVGSPFVFTEELVALLYLVMVFLTIPICTIRREHITVTAGVERVGPMLRRVLHMVASFVMLIFTSWFVIETWRFAAFSKQIEARSEQANILLWPWMGIIPAVMAFVGLIVVVQVWQSLRDLRTGAPAGPDRAVGDGL